MMEAILQRNQSMKTPIRPRNLDLRVSGSSVTFFSPSPRMKSSNLGATLSSALGFASRRLLPKEWIVFMVFCKDDEGVRLI